MTTVRPPLSALCLIALLVLAGCTTGSGPPAPRWDGDVPTTAATTPETDRVLVRGEELPVDASVVLARVENLTGTTVDAPTVIVEAGESGIPNFVDGDPVPTVFGLDGWEQEPGVHGKTSADGTRVHVFLGNGTDDEVEHVLAHEFVHVAQIQVGLPTAELRRRATTTDQRQATAALIEGQAVYVADHYARRHIDTAPTHFDMFESEYRRGPPGYRLFRSRYVFGGRYHYATVDSPENLTGPFRAPPRTTEAIIHNGTDDRQPPLSVTVDTTDWGRASPGRPWNDTQGELLVRNVLRSELSESAAATGAAGWGTDRLFMVRQTTDSGMGIVWALRWDNATEAAAFAGAFERYAERHGPTSRYDYRLVPVGSETTVVLAGTPSFVESARVAGSNADVTVTAGAG